MKNIMKSQLFKLKRDKICIFTFFAILTLSIAMIFMMLDMSADKTFTGGEEAAITMNMFMLLSQFFMYIFTAQMCGADFTDKTMNYEIMSGHTRAQVFFGRVIPCILIGTLGSLILIAAPVAVEVAMLGWGDKIKFSDILIRFMFMIFPIERIISEYVFLSYIIKNPYIVMGISYVLCIVLGINIPEGQLYSPILGMSNLNMLSYVDSWVSYGLGDDMYYIYETALTSGQIISTVVISLVFISGSLFLGYSFFKNDDMH